MTTNEKLIVIRLKLIEISYILVISYNHLSVKIDNTDNVDFEWEPHTNMNDFEIMDPFTQYHTLIQQDQGIGVIIIDPFEMYIKLYYDVPNQLKCICSTWNHSYDAGKLLEKDVMIGYDILFIDSDFKFNARNRSNF